MHVRRGDREGANELVLGIDVDVVLVAEESLAVLPRPTRLDILLLALGLAPVLRDLALFDAAILLAAVALDRHRDDGSINDRCRPAERRRLSFLC